MKLGKKMDYEKEEEELMVRLFGEIRPNSKLAWDKLAKEFNDGFQMMSVTPISSIIEN